ncbi:hypothetical protein [Bacillus sp. J33]|uniref:hypothetical protein n=1 Tax=Bacillus sp. J33 TaxID=935836 RepID=UPI00047AEFA3|nr:hypothetical protein [Bacillus sp. J33]
MAVFTFTFFPLFPLREERVKGRSRRHECAGERQTARGQLELLERKQQASLTELKEKGYSCSQLYPSSSIMKSTEEYYVFHQFKYANWFTRS